MREEKSERKRGGKEKEGVKERKREKDINGGRDREETEREGKR